MTAYQWLTAQQAQHELPALCAVLDACIAEGASIGFIHLDPEVLRHFWQDAALSLACGDKQLLVARIEGEIVATVMLALAMPPNGVHRAEVVKLLVHPRARRRGIARQLMCRAEQRAWQAGRTLLVLDTRSGDVAESLYHQLGWQVAGRIPACARSTAGEQDSTTLMYKQRSV
ncbi:GNAT family N-acetyltransferase [Erwinia pyrifoliae]|uniref:GNAT family N-acetyltransferase n=1 Tax=Erwinia pyrifoliae TaxID=79967 RepID=A0ABY5X4H4_ERWPY|nr:GNAT family N-acetyltransferase [Erwinia pyrifoliae]AUX72193.1 N-acetyltransferase [Erwinia pyrifoliae]MCA8877567.1 GNAT family N-acetyltransferase [Erwinia pyrifoliae]MCT2388444.1 GNAT family N-acetyltransferase [Erwinia pyrifoliae]MCU8586613.1 GNAT family N-acetyltransferase [Erwinia pyrifoliae]UWS30503.1 GNAT family N-acetyltransferase [Erwinia pyrifoliae]